MNLESFHGYDVNSIIYLCFGILGGLLFSLVTFYLSYKFIDAPPSLSPYTKLPLRRASDISYENKERVLRYLYQLHQYDNQMFNLEKAALCRETGRIFPNALTFFGTVDVDWTFLNKRCPGYYVSWGSLTDTQKEIILSSHHYTEDFQLEFSSKEPAPSKVEKSFALRAPGPLYVDLNTRVLIGWKIVPMTNLEVLIVQKPKGVFDLKN